MIFQPEIDLKGKNEKAKLNMNGLVGGGSPPATIGFRFRRSKRRRVMTQRFSFKLFPCFFLEKETQVSIFV